MEYIEKEIDFLLNCSGGGDLPPPRTSFGSEGKSIRLHANHFVMNVPKGYLYQYNITITPEKCPKRINRFV